MNPDHDLVARVLAGDDRHAFAELVRRHQAVVRGYLRRLTAGRDALADDLAQETFLAAYRNLARYRGDSAFSTWLLGIATFRARSALRREHPTTEWTGEIDPSTVAAGTDTATPSASTSVEMRTDLEAALATLPDEERSAVHLCYHLGLTHEEAASALQLPLGTLKTHIARAKDKLRRALQAWAPG